MRRISLVLFLGASAVPTMATTAAPAPSDVIAKVLACQKATVDAQRLVCFDRSTAVLAEAMDRHDVTVLEKEDVRRARRSLFGFTLPNLALLGIGEKGDDESPDEAMVDSSIRSVRSVSYGKWDMELEEHAVWRNIDLIDAPPRPGDKVHIKKGMVGSYFFKIGHDRAVRAERIR